MENEISHCDENLSSPQSKTTKLRKRRMVKEGDAASIPEDASASIKMKKKSKTTLTTDGWEGVGEVLIALKSQAKFGPRKAPLPVAADAGVGSATRSPTLSEMLGNDSSLQPKKQCPAAAVVDVEGYKVKRELAATAQYILNKHGDVVAVTSLKGSLLTHLLENVCQIYQKLEKSAFSDLTIEELEVMCIELHDFQKMNVNVGWLLSRLEDILNSKKVLPTLDQELMEAKEKFKRFLEKSLVDDI